MEILQKNLKGQKVRLLPAMSSMGAICITNLPTSHEIDNRKLKAGNTRLSKSKQFQINKKKYSIYAIKKANLLFEIELIW